MSQSLGFEYIKTDDDLISNKTTNLTTNIDENDNANVFITRNIINSSETCDKLSNNLINNNINNNIYENRKSLKNQQFIETDEIITVVVSSANESDIDGNSKKEITVIINESNQEQINQINHNDDVKSEKCFEKDSNNVNEEQKTDEKCEKFPDNDSKKDTENKSDEINKVDEFSRESDTRSTKINYPKSILCTNISNGGIPSEKTKSLLRKKSVSFDTEESIKKFTGGEEIIDKKNPFKQQNGDIENTVKYKIVKSAKKSSIPTKVPSVNKDIVDDSEFITKEEVLKQSKYVPVYVKNPDKYFTYDRGVLERLNSTESLKSKSPTSPKTVKKVPVPVPRKTKLLELKKEKEKKRKLRNPKYPDLSDIKVKVGTDLDESLYDPNEVVLNAKKFDSRFQKIIFGSQDDIDEIADISLEEKSLDTSKESNSSTNSSQPQEEKKSYTNTINSEEFREYLKRKGLYLFPLKANGLNKKPENKNSTTTTINQANSNRINRISESEEENVVQEIEKIFDMDNKTEKKKGVFSRLSSIFSKGKTTPKDTSIARSSYLNKTDDKPGSNINNKRVFLDRASFHSSDSKKRSSVPANNEFTRQFSSTREPLKRTLSKDEDKTSSISSVLTAAGDYTDNVPSPIMKKNEMIPKENYVETTPKLSQNKDPRLSLYRDIDLNRSKLYQTKVVENNSELPTKIDGSSRANGELIKPRVQRLTSAPQNGNSTQKPSQIKYKPPVPIRRSSERQSLPMIRTTEKTPIDRTVRASSVEKKPQLPERNYKMNGTLPNTPQLTNIYSNESYKTPNQSREQILDEPKSTSTPNQDKENKIKSPQISPIKGNGTIPLNIRAIKNDADIDPYTFVKLHEIKKRTDEVLLNKVSQAPSESSTLKSQRIYDIPPQRSPQKNIINESFVRNSPQRSTISDMYTNRLQKLPSRVPQSNGFRSDDEYANYATYNNINARQQQMRQQLPERSQSVLDGMTGNKYGDVQYRNLYGGVTLRRPESGTLDKKQIMQKIYEYYRKSVSSTPVPFQENNLRMKSQSTDTSPVSYASVNTNSTATLPKVPPHGIQNRENAIYSTIYKRPSSSQPSDKDNYANVYTQNRISYTNSDKTDGSNSTNRQKTISESDSVFLPEGVSEVRKVDTYPRAPIRYIVLESENITPTDVIRFQNQNLKLVPVQITQQQTPTNAKDSNRIYDSVYGSNIVNLGNGQYGQIKPPRAHPPVNQQTPQNQQKLIQRPASAMGYFSQQPVYIRQQQQQQQQHYQHPVANGRNTPLILQQVPVTVHQSHAGQQKDLYSNPNIYRPIASANFPQRYPAIPMPQQRHKQLNGQLQNGKSPMKQEPDRYRYDYPRRFEKVPVHHYESESGSEAGEVQRIMNKGNEEDWQNDKSGRNQQNEQVVDERSRRSSGRRGEDPRRHTLGADMLHYGNQGQLQRSMDLEGIAIKGYAPSNQGPLFDDDPGIMSEVETASTGFRRGGKQRSSLPVVRTPSKTLERPLGLVFLQYRSETKRALLPNEITSIDTVRALFVRSFPRQLTMAYLEGPNVKIYIHDSSKDMFYELEDVRSHLREIKDRSVLRLFESNEVAAPQFLPGGPGVPQPLPSQGGHWDQDQSYFSEPEFDSEYQHQHIHKSKTGKAPYYVTQTLPRGHVYTDRSKNSIGVPAKPLRSYGSRGSMGPQFPYPADQLYSIPDGYMSSPERGTRAYEEPYYSQYGTRGSSVTPIIDEEQNDQALIDDQYAMYGVKVPNRLSRNPANQIYDPSRPEDIHRIRVEHMERQLANLTGLVQKALVQNPVQAPSVNQGYLGVPGQYRSDKSVSFEKSVSFSDDIQGVPKTHSPQHLERTLKPAPPPKPLALATNQYRADLTLAPEVYNHLRGLQKKAKDLRTEVRTLRRLAQTQAVAVREDIKDTFMRIRATLLASSGNQWGQGDQERTRISREEEIYKQEVIRLEKDLADLEGSVEVLRGEVINRRTRVNMAAVEDMALVLSRASKTVAELKMRFPTLQQNLRNILANEMEKVCREENFLKDEPDRLETALRRCKKLTGTLVTLKRLASVQEQRTCVDTMPPPDEPPRSTEVQTTNKPIPSPRLGSVSVSGGSGIAPENALDALLDELQTFAKPPMGNEPRPDDSTSDDSSQTLQNTITTKLSQSQLYPETVQTHGLRRLHSYPSGTDTDTDTQDASPPQPARPTAGKPPVPERNAELLQRVRKVPPPPPPRTSSRSPLASPTSPNLQKRMPSLTEQHGEHQLNMNNNNNINSNSNINNNNQYPHHLHHDQDSGSESANSQDNSQRQLQLELRHQELLKKQKQLQEQYQRLQQMSKNAIPLAPNANSNEIKKTGSESNLPQKMGLNMSVSGSMKNLTAGDNNNMDQQNIDKANDNLGNAQPQVMTTTTNKVYETDIL